MNKRMREILAKIEAKQALAKGYMEGENKDVEKAKAITGKKFLIKIIGFNPEKIFNIDI